MTDCATLTVRRPVTRSCVSRSVHELTHGLLDGRGIAALAVMIAAGVGFLSEVVAVVAVSSSAGRSFSRRAWRGRLGAGEHRHHYRNRVRGPEPPLPLTRTWGHTASNRTTSNYAPLPRQAPTSAGQGLVSSRRPFPGITPASSSDRTAWLAHLGRRPTQSSPRTHP